MIDDRLQVGIGIDIGGTSSTAAVIDSSGTVLATSTLATQHGGAGVVETALRAATDVAAQLAIELDELDAVGVGIPGAVDPERGTVRFAVNVGLGAEPVEMGAQVAARLGVPVHVENDVRAAALGADWHIATTTGAVADLAYLSVGTGIAAGYVDRGRLRRGAHLVGGEIGHIPIDPAGPLCACGQTGCIEAIASGSAIQRAWPSANGTSMIELHRAVVAGDGAAERVWGRVIGGLTSAVLMLALTFDPEVIVLSGGVAALGEPLRTAIVERHSFDARNSEFLASLDLGARLRLIEPTVPLGPVGAILAARLAARIDATIDAPIDSTNAAIASPT